MDIVQAASGREAAECCWVGYLIKTRMNAILALETLIA
jgi:hypothetical protein